MMDEIELYEALTNQWQKEMISILQNTLKKYKVDDALAKEIVGDFTFDFAMLHDQYEIHVDGQDFNPRIGFDDFDGNILISEDDSFLHEYAYENTQNAYKK
ncbi:hypothetical protein [Sulfurovum mangrovi]|uniref:hypothetical protein n=1 Tax=Sulfurovum mangrovi TaxID=2893889 RepID=UPI001E47F6BC|nr:hypothetical protein [Sulfurovum mangrovi]UFH60288.1 hypothetical protein LN246_05415 [Sulfurovum mangrovi]